MIAKQTPSATGLFRRFVTQAHVTHNPAGDLIADMKADRQLPDTFASRERLETHLALRGACSEAMDVVPKVWRRYRSWLARNAAAVALLLAITPATGAEKIQDRHPAMVAQARDTTVHTFEERWAPVRGLLYRQQLGHEMLSPPPPPPPRVAPPAMAAAPPVEVAPVRERSVRTVTVMVRKPDQETCRRHGLRTVWSGNGSWRCRR